MQCPYCQKEISESGSVYCPHCGKQLSRGKKAGLRKGVLVTSLVWIIINAAFTIVVLALGLGFTLIDCLIIAVMSIVPAIYIFGVWAIYTVAKRHERNAIRWLTVAIVFSPAFAWAVYGLTWHEGQ
jgi:uncharacterized paraquat-inducible protein A